MRLPPIPAMFSSPLNPLFFANVSGIPCLLIGRQYPKNRLDFSFYVSEEIMNRRRFLGLGSSVLFSQLLDAQQCTPFGCRASLDFTNLAQSIQIQQCPEWCWAASISMIFGFHGHPLSQQEIVTQAYGSVLCLPAYTASRIAADLSDTWTDDNGNTFTSDITAAYDYQTQMGLINNTIIIDELLANRPLIYCNPAHAMVLCGVDYTPGFLGPSIHAAYVVDPWPFSPRIHALSLQELYPQNVPGGQMSFLAAVTVT